MYYFWYTFHLTKLEEVKRDISRQAGLGGKTETSATASYTSVSALPPVTPNGTKLSENSPNSLNEKVVILIPLTKKI